MGIGEFTRSYCPECNASRSGPDCWKCGSITVDPIKEIERLREALKHYADEKNWTQNYDEYSGLYYIPAMDRGDIARFALQQKDSE